MRHLVTQFPCAHFVATACLHNAIFWLAEVVQPALHGEVHRKRKASQTISQNSVMDVAATGVIAGKRRRPLPRLTTAPRVLIVAVGQRLVAGEPESLNQKSQQKSGRDALREIEAKASKDSEPVGHHVSWQVTV